MPMRLAEKKLLWRLGPFADASEIGELIALSVGDGQISNKRLQQTAVTATVEVLALVVANGRLCCKSRQMASVE